MRLNRFMIVLLVAILVFVSLPAFARQYHILYGFKIGQELKLVKKKMGKPDKVFDFEDGWKAYVYQLQGHNVIFETENTRPDLIISIQIQGYKNPEHMGLDGIDLGSDAGKARRHFGRPTERRQSVDLKTKKPIAKTFINYYGNSYSFEEAEGKVTSIKVLFAGAIKSGDRPDIESFFTYAKRKNFYDLAEQVSSDLSLRGKKAVNGPLLTEIIHSKKLHTIFFHRKKGVAALSKGDIADVNIRIIGADRKGSSPGSTGYVYKFKKGKPIRELYFIQSFEGWVLYDIY